MVTAGASVPASVAVGAGLTSAGATGAAGLLGVLGETPAEPDPLPLGGGTPDEVLTNMWTAFDDINAAIRTEEGILSDLLSTTNTETGTGRIARSRTASSTYSWT